MILIFIFLKFNWSGAAEVLATTSSDVSKIHPMHTSQVTDFNIWYVLISIFAAFYAPLAWQGQSAYGCSAKSPHESKMSGIVGTWRGAVIQVFLVIPGVVAFVILSHANHSSMADSVNAIVGSIGNSHISRQMIVPVVMSKILPWGLRGALCAAMLAAFISTHDTYMHSWGSIFIQDIVMPFRNKPFEQQQHLRLLKFSILGVAVIICLYSILYRQNQPIFMYFAQVGAIFAGGCGPAIIGGLYWKKGNSAGAWASMLAGATIAISTMVCRQIWPGYYGHDFPINSMYMWAIIMAVCSILYIVFSLIVNKNADMDRLLHRGKYNIEKEEE